ncbi:MAG TPA: DUF2283 domain-containing protein [Chloroflexota bacterium]|nr:DUF2283 domain-containing protein [Chloroflexota bacterium]
MAPRTVLYDEDDDVLVVRFSDAPYGWAAELDADRRVFYAQDGSPLAVIVERASRGIDTRELPHAETVLAAAAPALARRPKQVDDGGMGRHAA